VARARHVRVIAPDRPGAGGSDPQPRRRLLDWPNDVRALADSLRIERFAVAGLSGGGPYAAACAWALPERVTAAAILSGIGPTDVPGVTRGMTPPNRAVLWVSRNLPFAARALVGLMALQLRNPERAIARMARGLPEPDREALADPETRRRLIAEVRESLVRGTEGAVSDFRIFAQPWGFPLGEIRVPVHVWHGELDRNSPAAMARHVAAQIPGARANIGPRGGHLFPIQHLEDVLKGLGL
jgi:pimeloyl-ACP methyl ester carboxylesterase